MLPEVVWYYDVISPFAYLQAVRLPELCTVAHVVPRPILFAGLLKHWGQLGPAEIPAKRLFTYKRCQWLAEERGLPFRMPPAHPFNPLPALRLLTAMDADIATVAEALAFVFADGQGVEDDAGLDRFARRLAATDAQRAAAFGEAVKAKLRQATEVAVAAGVFGVPTFVADGELFWGEDSEGMLRAHLADPTCFKRGEMARIDALPEGSTRRRG